MSNLAYARPQPAPTRERHPRHIEIVTTRQQRRARPRAVYAVVTVASVFVIFAAQLLLSIVVADGAYQIEALQAQQKELLRTEQDLGEKFEVLSSTQHLAMQATHLGMVPNSDPFAIDVATGGVFLLPGSADPGACAGTCNIVSNSLLAGLPLVDPGATQSPPASGGAAPPPPTTTVDALPAPVTR